MRILRRFAGNSSISRDLQNCKNVSIWQKVVNVYYIEKDCQIKVVIVKKGTFEDVRGCTLYRGEIFEL